MDGIGVYWQPASLGYNQIKNMSYKGMWFINLRKKQTIKKLPCLVAVFFLFGCEKLDQVEPDKTPSVIIDSDMVEAFDDGVAFMILLGSDNMKVKGLTTVTGNTWAQEALAYGIRIGELCGGRNLTYIAGAQYPMHDGRLDAFNAQIDASPGVDASYRGSMSYAEVTDWKAYYVERYGQEPEIRPSSQEASEYIAQQIMSEPGQVTILAIGPCTNIAKAIEAHPEIVENVREIIYMGGAVYCSGNTTPYAEMNFLYDPEAAAICLRAPFPKQTLVSLDVCNTVEMDKSRFMEIFNSIQSEKVKELFRNNYAYKLFEDIPSATQLVWDLISAVIVLDSSIVTQYKDVRLDVDDDPESPTYGKVFESQQASRQIIRVPLEIDQDRFWNIVISHLFHD